MFKANSFSWGISLASLKDLLPGCHSYNSLDVRLASPSAGHSQGPLIFGSQPNTLLSLDFTHSFRPPSWEDSFNFNFFFLKRKIPILHLKIFIFLNGLYSHIFYWQVALVTQRSEGESRCLTTQILICSDVSMPHDTIKPRTFSLKKSSKF